MSDQKNGGDDPLAMMLGEVVRVETVRRYVNGAPRAAVEAATAKQPASAPVENTFARGLQWLGTMAKLNRPTDFQASNAGARAMLEMVVDLSLIAGKPAEHPLDKLVAWEQSAMLKHADGLARLDNTHDPELGSILNEWRTKHRESVQAGREKWWPPTGNDAGKAAKHPKRRWTGNDLAVDAQRANEVSGSDGILAVYERMHAMFCWATHGTGAVGILSTLDFPGHNMTALNFGAQLGLHVARLSLVHFGLYDAAAEAANDEAKAQAERDYKARVRQYAASKTKR
jgi:hypothetical protein